MNLSPPPDLLSPPVTSGLAMRDLLYVLFKYKRQMVIICITAVAVAAAYLLFSKPVYKAEASILIKLGKDELSAIETIPREQTNFVLQQRTQIINNEIEILRSAGMAWRVAPAARTKRQQMEDAAYANAGPFQRQVIDLRRQLRDTVKSVGNGIKSVTVAAGISRAVTEEQAFAIDLSEKIEIIAVEETEVIRIAYSADNAEYASFVTNAYLDEYFRTRIQVHDDERSGKFYEDQIAGLQEQLQQVERDIASFLRERGVTSLDLQKDLLVREIADLEKQYFQVSLALKETSVRQAQVARAGAGGVGVVPAPPTSSGANYSSLDEAYFRLAAEQAQLGARYGPEAREMLAVNEQQARLREEKATGVTRGLTGDAVVRQSERNSIETRLRQLKLELTQMNEATVPLADMERQRDRLRVSYLGYAKQAEELRLSFDLNRAQITSVKTLNHAAPPILPAGPKRHLVLALALAAGILLSFAWAVVSEFFNHTFRDARDVEAQLGIPTLASVGWDEGLAAGGRSASR